VLIVGAPDVGGGTALSLVLPDQLSLRRILLSIERFLRVEQVGGIALLAATAIALIAANSPWHAGYEALWQTRPVGSQTLEFWINDGLMTLFFLVVGLEIRHEIHEGCLSNPRIATLPILMAIAGVTVPALIYLALNSDGLSRRGWAVPTATDIAFAVGVLSLVAKQAPPALRMLLLTLAIVDDIIAIVIIATFYSGGVAVSGLALVGCGIVVAWLMRRFAVRHPLAYVLPGAVLWFGMLRAGIHPTLAGVALGLLVPPADSSSRMLRSLHLLVVYVIMPLFALANAGVSFQGVSLATGVPLSVTLGIICALVLGKPVGILLAGFAAVRSKAASLPEGIEWRHLVVLGCLGGIGFTMSLFIANLAFPDPGLLATSKFAVLLASVLAAVVSSIVGRIFGSRQ
jgi:NhaA family Na+:H+ antiporter